MMTKQKGILTSDSKLASGLAYQIRGTQDFNAVIYDKNIDKRALSLARDLTGITQANSCPIWAKCRINPSDPKAPRIYVACLSAYNNGHLHGWWIDADQEPDALLLNIEDMLAESPMDDAEEWAIHDYENFDPIHIDEHEDLEKLCQWANIISSHKEESGAIAAYISWAEDVGLEVSSEEFASRYCGHWDDGKDFALKSGEIEELYNWSQFEKEHHFWSMHIDWESVARDLELSDAYYYASASQSEGYGIYVFRYC
jgi:antirestriction protein